MSEFDFTKIEECTTVLPPGACPVCGGEAQVPKDEPQDLANGPNWEPCTTCKGTGVAACSDNPEILRAEILRLTNERAAMVHDAILVGYASCVLLVQKATVSGMPAPVYPVVEWLLVELKNTEKEIKALGGVVADDEAAKLSALLASIRKEVGMAT